MSILYPRLYLEHSKIALTGLAVLAVSIGGKWHLRACHPVNMRPEQGSGRAALVVHNKQSPNDSDSLSYPLRPPTRAPDDHTIGHSSKQRSLVQ